MENQISETRNWKKTRDVDFASGNLATAPPRRATPVVPPVLAGEALISRG
jgi:hypothetical protein